MTNSPITKFKLYCIVVKGNIMDDYWYWEIKFYINFPSGKREGTYSVDRQNASTAELAQKLQISGTPTFILGGQFLRGFVPLEMLLEVAQSERKK